MIKNVTKLFILFLALFSGVLMAQPSISVTPLSLDFGTIAVVSDSVRSVSITNTGTSDLHITGVVIAGTPFNQFRLVDPLLPPVTIAPGAPPLILEVQFSPSQPGLLEATMQIYSDDPLNNTVNIPLQGNGVGPDIALIPDALNFGAVPVGQDSLANLQIANPGNDTLVVAGIIKAGADSSQFRLENLPAFPASIPPGAAPISIGVRFQPGNFGLKTARVEVSSNDFDQDPAAAELLGTGLAPDISVNPAQLDFGNVLVQGDSVQELEIANLGNDTLVVSGAGIVGPNNSLFEFANPLQLPLRIAPNDPPFPVSIRFAPDSVGAKSAFLVLTSNDPDGGQNPLVVQMNGAGVVSDIAVSDSSLDFGNVVAGRDSLRTLQISNQGAGALIITDLNIIGANAAEFQVVNAPPLPFQIRPGAAPVEVQLRFGPASRGVKEALLAITSNDPDPDENPLFVSLSGTAFESDIDAQPPSLQFGMVWVGQSQVLSTYLMNLGDADLIIDSLMIRGTHRQHFQFIDSYQYPITLPVGSDSLEILLRFAPLSIGDKSASLTVVSNDPDENPFEVPLSGSGIEPNILVFPGTLSYGGVRVGNEETRNLQIFNLGSAPLTISDTLFSGEDARLFSLVDSITLPVVIPPFSNPVSWRIRFLPDSVGVKTARFRLVSDDPDGNSSEAVLTGEGIQPGIDVVPPELDFDSVRVFMTEFRSLQIFNTGTDVLRISGLNISGADSALFGFNNLPGLPIDISPDADPLVVTLRFSPDSLGEKTAVLHILSDDPNTPESSIPLRGRGVEPDIELSVDTLDFGASVVGLPASGVIDVFNRGDDDLFILTMVVNGGAGAFRFQDSPPGSVTLRPGDTLSVPLQFLPDTLGDFIGQLQILSDDPDEQLLNIPLLGRGVLPEIALDADTLDFGFVKLNTRRSRPLGITNRGGAPLLIQSLTLLGPGASRYQIGDLPEPPFVISDSTDTVFVNLFFRPEDKGRSEAVLEITSNDTLHSPYQVVLAGTGVKGPVLETLDLAPIVLNRHAPLSIRVGADTTLRQVSLYLGPADTAGFPLQLPLIQEEPGVYSGSIPDSLITTAGLKMFFELIDDYPVVTRDTLYPRVTIPQGELSHRFETPELNRWQMFSLPFAAATEAAAGIDQILSSLGPEGDFTWRIFRTDASGRSENYFTRTELNNMGAYGRFEPGNAFWLFVRQDEDGQPPTTQLEFPQLLTLPGDSTVVNLLPGWNQVGNPYAFPVGWNQVSSPLRDTLNVYHWDGQTWSNSLQKVGWTPLVNRDFTLQPWDGYAVFNPLPDTVALTFHPAATDSATAPRQLLAGGWQLQLAAESPSTYDINVLGMHPLARPGIDRFDYRNPAAFQEPRISLAFHQADQNGKRIPLSSDFRPVNPEGDLWYLTLESSKPQASIRIRRIEHLPASFRVVLYDTKYRREYPLRPGQPATVNDLAAGEVDRFAVLVGTPGFIARTVPDLKLMAPAAYELLPNYPNPFNPATTIRFQLKQGGRVSLAIYNLLGQKVRQLADEFYQAGFYELRWDGRDATGRETASGLYFYRIQVNDFSRAVKMIKMK